MPTQFKIHDDTWGTLQIFAIRIKEDGTWEEEWEPLRAEEEVADLLSRISWEAFQELLHRYTRPFLQEVGLGPEACLIKLSEERGACYYRDTCPSYDPKLCAAHLDPPSCYDSSIDPQEVRNLLTRLVDLWRFGFYVILVPENT